MEKYRCKKCGNVQVREPWSDRPEVPLKCTVCKKLTMHTLEKTPAPSLVQQDCPMGG